MGLGLGLIPSGAAGAQSPGPSRAHWNSFWGLSGPVQRKANGLGEWLAALRLIHFHVCTHITGRGAHEADTHYLSQTIMDHNVP